VCQGSKKKIQNRFESKPYPRMEAMEKLNYPPSLDWRELIIITKNIWKKER